MKRIKLSLYNKLQRLKGDPKLIARSFALGSFMGVTPLIGMQVLLSVLISYIFRLSKAAAIVGVFNTNWTKGLFLYPLNYKIGCWILGIKPIADIKGLLTSQGFYALPDLGVLVFISLLIGGLITGSMLAVFYYFLVLKLIKGKTSPPMQTKPGTDVARPYAMITGASQGLGKAIAMELASRKIPLLLVSLEKEGLHAFAEELRMDFGIEVQCFETDFFRKESVYELAHWAIPRFPVNILINNAGLGGTKAFDEASPEYVDTIIQVNVRATSMLTRLMLPELKKHQSAFILNVASMASFSPFAYKTVYPASKAFIYSFSRGLHEELRGTGVNVSVIHPGPMKTNADVTERIEKQGVFGRVGLVSAEKTAKIAITQLLKRDSLILPGTFNKINWLLMVLIPNAWKLPMLSRVVRQEIHTGRTARKQWAVAG